MKKLNAVTQEQWEEVCEFNRDILQSFLADSVELSPKSKKAYESNLKICVGERQSKQQAADRHQAA